MKQELVTICRGIVNFFDKTWLGKTLSITLAILLGVAIISYAQAKGMERIHEKIEAQYAKLNCIKVWKQMKRGDEI